MKIYFITLLLSVMHFGFCRILNLSGPLYSDTIVPAVFTIKSQDPENENISYEIDWADGNIFKSDFFVSGTEIEQEHIYKKTGKFEINIKVQDSKGNIVDDTNFTITIGDNIIRWRYELPSGIYSTPALDSLNNIYFTCEDGALYVLSPGGNLLWRFLTQAPIYSSPTIGKNIYITSTDSNLYCLGFDGKLKWSFKTGEEIYASCAIDNKGNIIFGSDNGKLYCLNPSGKLLWSYQTGDEISGSPVIGLDGTIYIGSDSVYAITPQGKRSFAISALEDDYFFASPVVTKKGVVYIGSTDGRLYAILPTGRLLWHSATNDEDPIRSEVIIGKGDTIYLTCEDGFVYKKGKFGGLIPVFEAEYEILSAPAVDSLGNIYFLSEEGFLYSISKEGRLNWRLEIASSEKELFYTSTPVIDNNGIGYIGSWDGFLYSFRAFAPPPNSDWQTFRGDLRKTGRVKR